MKKILILVLFFLTPSIAFSDEYEDGYIDSSRRKDRAYNEESSDSENEERKARRRPTRDIRNNHAKTREKIKSLTSEQRKEIRQERDRHRKRMREILGDDSFDFPDGPPPPRR